MMTQKGFTPVIILTSVGLLIVLSILGFYLYKRLQISKQLDSSLLSGIIPTPTLTTQVNLDNFSSCYNTPPNEKIIAIYNIYVSPNNGGPKIDSNGNPVLFPVSSNSSSGTSYSLDFNLDNNNQTAVVPLNTLLIVHFDKDLNANYSYGATSTSYNIVNPFQSSREETTFKTKSQGVATILVTKQITIAPPNGAKQALMLTFKVNAPIYQVICEIAGPNTYSVVDQGPIQQQYPPYKVPLSPGKEQQLLLKAKDNPEVTSATIIDWSPYKPLTLPY